MRRSHAFTVVELLVVLGLLSIVLAIVGIRPLAFFQDTKEKESKRLIEKQIAQAQKYAALTDSSVTYSMEKEGNTLMLSMKGQKLPDKITKELIGQRIRIEQAPALEVITSQKNHLQLPLFLVFYPNGQCREERSSELVEAIEISPHTSNAKPLTISLTPTSLSSYETRAPDKHSLYPKLQQEKLPHQELPYPEAELPSS